MYSRTFATPGKTTTTYQGTLPLPMATAGQRCTVSAVKGNDETKAFLGTLGFVPGAEVSVVSQCGGNLIIEVKGSRIAVGSSMAMRVLVK